MGRTRRRRRDMRERDRLRERGREAPLPFLLSRSFVSYMLCRRCALASSHVGAGRRRRRRRRLLLLLLLLLLLRERMYVCMEMTRCWLYVRHVAPPAGMISRRSSRSLPTYPSSVPAFPQVYSLWSRQNRAMANLSMCRARNML